MANSHTDHSKKQRAANAVAYTRAKLASGAMRQYTIRAAADQMDIIDEAVIRAGGSRTQALLSICRHYLDSTADQAAPPDQAA